jgi:hypothetical protein
MLLDADGRKLSFLHLGEVYGGDPVPDKVAAWLREALEADPEERFILVVGGSGKKKVDSFIKVLENREGVTSISRSDDRIVIHARAGALTAEEILEPMEKEKLPLRLIEPVAVRFSRAGNEALEAKLPDLSAIPGAWSITSGDRPTAFIARLLLEPAALASADASWVPDVEEKRFRLPGVSTGPRGARPAFKALECPGVLAVFPDLWHESIAVVGRKHSIDWGAVLKAFRDAGVMDAEMVPE